MPELPEVETVRRQLADSLVGLTFTSVEKVEPAMLRDCTVEAVRLDMPGRRVESVERLGKFLLVRLSGRAGAEDCPSPIQTAEAFLTLHLGMTGQLLVDPEEPGPHSRFLFELTNDEGTPTRLEFRDTRKFGRLHLTTVTPAPRLAGLGPDAWQGEWDADYLERRLHGRKAPLKAFLLDQRHLAGIGNIYADEILWWSGLSPLRQSGSVGGEVAERLAREIRRTLGEGVRLLGCSFSDFVDTAGKPGGFQDWLRAYGKQGELCRRCGSILVRVIVAGRGTAFCPGCQK
jgi:formamidopyrimidine-DNA glycosylase